MKLTTQKVLRHQAVAMALGTIAIPTAPLALAETEQLEEVLVTASRREESLQNVGAAITSIDPEAYSDIGLSTLENIIDYTPGVSMTSIGSRGFGQITMRGATQEGAAPVVGIYVDDVPLTSGSPFSFGNKVVFDGLLADIERVEVVKGPQGTLYGANSVGGVIRYITKDPALDEFRARVNLDLSSTEHGDWNQRYSGSVSVPVVEDTFGVTLSGFVSDEAGFIDLVDTPVSPAQENYNGSDSKGYQLAALWQVAERASVKLMGLHFENDVDMLQLVDVSYPDGEPVYGPYRSDAQPGPETLEYDSYSATVNVEFDWATLTSVTAWVEYFNDLYNDGTPVFGPLVDQVTGAPVGTNQVPIEIRAESEKIVQELRLTSPSSDRFEWLAGFFYTDEDTDNSQSGIAEPSQFSLFEVTFPSTYEEMAVFGNLTWYLTPDIDVTVGARYSDNSLDLDARFAGLLGAGAPDAELLFGDKIDDTVTTYLFGARWRVNDDTSLYTRIASGYRPAAVNLPVFNPATGENVVEPFVDADTLWSYEIGAKGQALDGRLRYDTALWYIQWDEFKASIVYNGVTTAGNADSAIEAWGFEGGLTFYPVEALSIQAALAYNHSELEDDDPTLGAMAGEESRSLPDWTGSLRVGYEFPVGGLRGRVGGGVRYVGGYDTAYSSGVPGSGGAVNFEVDGYALLDLDASVSGEFFTATLYATNITDEYEFANVTATDSVGGVVTDAVIVQPRTVGVSLTLKF